MRIRNGILFTAFCIAAYFFIRSSPPHFLSDTCNNVTELKKGNTIIKTISVSEIPYKNDLDRHFSMKIDASISNADSKTSRIAEATGLSNSQDKRNVMSSLNVYSDNVYRLLDSTFERYRRLVERDKKLAKSVRELFEINSSPGDSYGSKFGVFNAKGNSTSEVLNLNEFSDRKSEVFNKTGGAASIIHNLTMFSDRKIPFKKRLSVYRIFERTDGTLSGLNIRELNAYDKNIADASKNNSTGPNSIKTDSFGVTNERRNALIFLNRVMPRRVALLLINAYNNRNYPQEIRFNKTNASVSHFPSKRIITDGQTLSVLKISSLNKLRKGIKNSLQNSLFKEVDAKQFSDGKQISLVPKKYSLNAKNQVPNRANKKSDAQKYENNFVLEEIKLARNKEIERIMKLGEDKNDESNRKFKKLLKYSKIGGPIEKETKKFDDKLKASIEKVDETRESEVFEISTKETTDNDEENRVKKVQKRDAVPTTNSLSISSSIPASTEIAKRNDRIFIVVVISIVILISFGIVMLIFFFRREKIHKSRFAELKERTSLLEGKHKNGSVDTRTTGGSY